ncbi:MAG: class I adenylate-forming enzyme family protein [Thermoanaerobaculales bacterium]
MRMVMMATDIQKQALTVGDIARHPGSVSPRRIALREGKRCLSYADANRRADGLATALRRLGIRGGDMVTVFLPSCIDYLLIVLATARVGAVFSPINPRYKIKEVTDIVARARPGVVFTDDERLVLLETAIADVGLPAPRVILSGPGQEKAQGDSGPLSFDRLAETDPGPVPPISGDDHFSLLFTSGTTGTPKGALATHRARMLWVLNAVALYGLSADDVYLSVMPQVHSAGLTFALMHLYVGGTVEILRDFDPDDFLQLVERHGVTSSLAVPSMLTMILETLDRTHRCFDFSSLRRLVSCGAPLEPGRKKQIIERLTPHLYDYYGSTESNSMTVLLPGDQLRKPASVGKPFSNVELKIVAADGSPPPVGEAGLIWCRNPSVMTGYLGQEEETRAVFEDGWFNTGDLGYLDDEGFLFLVGRDTDIINSGGFNIYPREVEQVLFEHPGVLDCAVVGTPHPTWGQAVSAYIVAREDWNLGLTEVQQHVSQHLADFKKPRKVKFVKSLPKNAGGKTIKSALPPM